MATVFVTQPGNLSDPKRLAKLDKLVDDMEHIHGSWGPVGTQYFVRDYRNFLSTFEDLDVDLEDEEGEEESTALSTTVKPNNNSLLSFRGEDLETFVKWPEYRFVFLDFTRWNWLENRFFLLVFDSLKNKPAVQRISSTNSLKYGL